MIRRSRDLMKATTCPRRLTKRPESKNTRPSLTVAWQRILVPVDFSRVSKSLLGYVCTLAMQHAAEVDLLHVVEPIHDIRDFGYGPVARKRPNTVALARANVRLRTLARRHLQPLLAWRAFVRSGTTCEEIVRFAQEMNTALIVVAVQGLLPLGQIKVSGRIISHSPCPVLVLRTPLLTQPTSHAHE